MEGKWAWAAMRPWGNPCEVFSCTIDWRGLASWGMRSASLRKLSHKEEVFSVQNSTLSVLWCKWFLTFWCFLLWLFVVKDDFVRRLAGKFAVSVRGVSRVIFSMWIGGCWISTRCSCLYDNFLSCLRVCLCPVCPLRSFKDKSYCFLFDTTSSCGSLSWEPEITTFSLNLCRWLSCASKYLNIKALYFYVAGYLIKERTKCSWVSFWFKYCRATSTFSVKLGSTR